MLAALLSTLAAGILLSMMAGLAIRRPALCMLYFFVLFAFAFRLVSALYIDLFGPLVSEQLERSVGPGTSALPLAISQGIVIVAMLFSFRSARLRELIASGRPSLASHLPPGRFAISDLAFWLAALFAVALWLELFVKGPIPLFVAMERYDYARQYGGPLLHLLLHWGPMLALQLGIFLVAPVFRDRTMDWRFAGLFACLIVYLFLVGYRFSSFYAYTSFFIIPIGAALIGRPSRQRPLFSKTAFRYVVLAGVMLCCAIVAAILYSYVVVRGQGAELHEKLTQRVLVQQGEMWWMTYERVFVQGDWSAAHAANKLFVDPFDWTRNSTMQYLMELGLPVERAHSLIGQGSAYAGGWPEVFFELGGPIGGFVLVAVSAIVFSEFMFLLTRCIVQERFATCFFLTPILFALENTVVSGMVNSFIQVSFLIKVAAALIVYLTEDRWRSSMLQYPQFLDPEKRAEA